MGRLKGGAPGPGRPKASPESRKLYGKTTMSFSIGELKVLNRLLRSPWWRKQARDSNACKCLKKEAKCQQVHHLFRYLASGSLDQLLVDIRNEITDVSRQLISSAASAQLPRLSERLMHVAGKLPAEVLPYDPSDDVDFSVQKSQRAELKELRRVESMDDSELDQLEAQLLQQQHQLRLLQQQRGTQAQEQAPAGGQAQAQHFQQHPAAFQPLSSSQGMPLCAAAAAAGPSSIAPLLYPHAPSAARPPLPLGHIPLEVPRLQSFSQVAAAPLAATAPADQVPDGSFMGATDLVDAAVFPPVLPAHESCPSLLGCASDRYELVQEAPGLSAALPPCGFDAAQPGHHHIHQAWLDQTAVSTPPCLHPGLAPLDEAAAGTCMVGTR